MIETLIGRNFLLYPRSTLRKEGILLSVDEHGFCFRITYQTDSTRYKVGDIYFISKGEGLTCVLMEEEFGKKIEAQKIEAENKKIKGE
jgi:hypothetical protein